MESAATELVSATYHVFVNHRGADVKKNLASCIYHRLTNCHGLRVFLDEKELHAGYALSPAIVGAIESASVHITIFSKRYAESRWCLDELCWILKCNRKIIPVFYDVEPTDLRYIDSEKGRYKKDFEKHQRQGRVAIEDIEKWKAALNKASEISGLLFKTNESDCGEVLEEIVKAVLKGVKWEPFELPKYLVGLDPAVKEINDEIKKQSELNGTVIVGIAGMAGVGKSTLATYLYNLKRSDFTRSCFLSEIRKKDLPALQRKLLRDLLGCDFHIEDTRHGNGIFRDRLIGLQVLIVLDDVGDMEQIKSLVHTDVVGSRSLIFITSRDQDLLRHSSPKAVVYNLKPLQGEHAQELFCLHVFEQSEPSEGFECLVEEVLKICGGLPLSLQVLGTLFLGRHEKEYWKRQLEKLPRRLPDDIMKTLKVSYEALNKEDQEIFLDLGCFLLGEDKEVAVRVFEGLGYKDACDCLENLRQKCLIEYQDTEEKIDGRHDPDGGYDYLYLPKTQKITMHDHIRQLARHIASEEFGVLPPRKPLRVGCSDDIQELMLKLQGGADFCLIRGIRTLEGQNLPDCTNYIKGVGVRLFVFEIPIDLSSLFGSWHLSGDLVWLRLRSFNSIYFPDTISLGNLRVLELEVPGGLEQLFQRFTEPPRNLSVLNINLTDTQRPRTILNPSVHPTVNLQSQQSSLGSAPPISRRHLWLESGASSSSLDLQDSPGFQAFYFHRFMEWIGTSINIPSKIVLKNIRFLQSLSIGFGELQCLRHLDLSGCTNLTQLPKSFSELMHLQCLVLRDCTQLFIPIDFLGNMSSLEYVDFRGCHKLKYLPTGIANQRSLSYLNLLKTDVEWPLNVELPKKLQQLRIGNSPSLPSGSIEPLDWLQSDSLVEWSSFSIGSSSLIPENSIFELSSFSAEECSIEEFSFERSSFSIEECSAEEFSLERSVKRKKVERTKLRQSLRDLRRLKELILIHFNCPGGILWEEIAGPNIKLLVIRDCPIDIFEEQRTMDVAMGALIDFTLTKTRISEICIPEGVLPSLETLDLSENRFLMQVKDLPSTLVRLDLRGCSRLKALIHLSNLVDLKFLCLNNCQELEILNVEGLTSLEEIQAEECMELKSIPGLSQLERLKYIRISTNTDVLWNDICNFLTSTSHKKLSTAFFTGKSTITYSDTDMVVQQSITEKFKVKVVDVVFPATASAFNVGSFEFQRKMESFQTYGGILMCFLTISSGRDQFRVKFEAGNDSSSADEYTISGGNQWTHEQKLHVFMWTEESGLFRDYKGYDNIGVYCHTIPLSKGWLIMVDKSMDVSQICKQIIIALS